MLAEKFLQLPADWFVWFQVEKLIGSDSPDGRCEAHSFSSELSNVRKSHLHWMSVISQFAV